MKETTILVTGATGAIGGATAKAFASAGARVVLMARNEQKVRLLRERIAADTGNERVDILTADLGDFVSIRRAVAEFKDRYSQLHVFVHSAALIEYQRRVLASGYEAMFATNHLGPFLLTNLLLDRLKASAPARILYVLTTPPFARLDFDNLQSERQFSPVGTFSLTKLCNLFFVRELARRLEGTGVAAIAFDPRFVKNEHQKTVPGLIGIAMRLMRPLASQPDKPAAALAKLGLAPEYASANGQYFEMLKERAFPKNTQDEKLRERLWTVSAQMAGLAV